MDKQGLHPVDGVTKGITATVVNSSSHISNQLEAGPIIFINIKSVSVPSLPSKVYDPIWSTINASQVFVMASFAGSFPSLCYALC